MKSRSACRNSCLKLLSFLGAIFYSVASQAQWSERNLPEGRLPLSVDATSATTFYAGDNEAVFKTTNGGSTWQSINKQFTNFNPGFEFLYSSIRNRVYFLNENVGFVYAMSSTALFRVIYKTINGGNTWTLVHYSAGLDLQDMYFASDQVGYAVGLYGGIVKTIDGGSNWVVQQSPTQNGQLYGVFFTDDNHGIAVGDGIILRTSNGGVNWSLDESFQQSLYAVKFIDDNTGYISGSNVLLKTTDGGNTWAPVRSNITNAGTSFYKVVFTDSQTGFLASGKGLYKTNDGGNFWAIQSSTKGLLVSDVDFVTGTQAGVLVQSGSPNIRQTRITNTAGDPMPLRDVTLTEVNQYSTNLCRGVYEVKARIMNNAPPTLGSTEVHWSVDGIEQPVFQWTGNLAVLDTSAWFTIGTYNFNKSFRDFQVKVWVVNPNGGTDENPEDNSLNVVYRFNVLSGTYTIGGTSPDFNSLGAAAAALNQYGICQSVVFNFRPGTYENSATLNSIRGAAETATITFQSETNDPHAVILNQAVGLVLSSTSYITFRNLSFESSSSQSIGISRSTGIVFEKNIFSASTGSLLRVGASGKISVTGNLFIGGEIGIEYSYPDRPSADGIIEIANNKFEGQRKAGISFNDVQEQLIIRNNKITSAAATSHGYYGIYVMVSAGDAVIHNNYIYSSVFGTGINVSRGNAKIYYNTVVVNGGQVIAATDGIFDLKNNILFNALQGTVLGLIKNPASFSSDYNNLYAPGSYIGRVNRVRTGGSAELYGNDLPAWQAISGYDEHSISVDPQLVDGSPLVTPTTVNHALNGAALPLPEILTDIEGQPRNATAPDIGADEFLTAAVDAGITNVLAEHVNCGGTGTVGVEVTNFGIRALSNFTLRWSVDNEEQIPVQASVGAGQTSVVNLGSFGFSSGKHRLVVTLEASGDLVGRNDTISQYITTGGLSGTFTVGGFNPDYETLADAMFALKNGICGAVSLNIRPGLYSEPLVIPLIPGASEHNSVIITSESGDPESVVIFPDGFGATVTFDGTAWVSVKNLSLKGAAQGCMNIVEFTNNTSHVTLDNNLILGFISGRGVATVNGSRFDAVTVSNNTLKIADDGYFMDAGISVSDAYGNANRIIYNKIMLDTVAPSNPSIGIEVGLQSNILIHKNVVRAHTGLAAGRCFNNSEVSANEFVASVSGVQLTEWINEGISNSRVVNNFIKSGKGDGLRIVSSTNLYVRNNTIVSHAELMTVLFDFFYHGFPEPKPVSKKVDFKNNIVINAGSGVCVATAIDAPVSSDFNVFYSPNKQFMATMPEASWNLSAYPTTNLYTGLFEWTKVTGMDTNSVFLYPRFVSDTDLHIRSDHRIANAGAGGSLTTDIDGNVRDAQHPDIGADEFDLELFPNDAGISKVVRPDECGPDHPVKVKIKNFGTSSLTNTVINWSVNGTLMSPVVWNGSLAQGVESGEFTIGSVHLNPSDSFKIAAWTTLPNNTPDQEQLNDSTFVYNVMQKLNGVYTIGHHALADFPSHQAAARYLNRVGLCGPATFQVMPGTYDEVVVIENVVNTSDVNKITFQAKDGPNTAFYKTLIEIYSRPGVNFLIKNTSHVTFKELNFLPHPWGTGTMIKTEGPVTYCEILGNHFNTERATRDSSGIGGIYLTSGASDILIAGNYFGVTGIGVAMENTDRIRIESNRLRYVGTGFDLKGFSRNVEIVNNSIESDFGESGINVQSIGPFLIQNNKIFGAYNYPLSIRGSGDKYTESLVVNNMISSTDYSYAGIISASNKNIQYYHNSVQMSSSHPFYHGIAAFESENDSLVQVVNNIFVNRTRAGLTIFSGLSILINTHPLLPLVLDHNDLWSPDSLYMFNSVRYDNLGDYQRASGMDQNSVSINPIFISENDLHALNPAVNKLGQSLPSVTTDIDGDARDPVHPDMGADEFYVPSFDSRIASINPFTSVCQGTNDVYVTVRNMGRGLLTNATIVWSVNGVSQPAVEWTGALTVGEISEPVKIGTFSFGKLVTYTIVARTLSPNGHTDEIPTNDTCERSVKPAASGTFTIGGDSPDFPTISDAVTVLKQHGVCGAVVFNIRNGIYHERVILPEIAGASQANRITFKSESNIADNVTITAETDEVNQEVWRLESADYITLEQLTFSPLGAKAGRGIRLEAPFDSLQYIFIQNNIFNLEQVPNDSDFGTAGIVMSGGLIIGSKIQKNIILGGNTGIVVNAGRPVDPVPVDMNVIFQNELVNQTLNGIYVDGPFFKVEGNTVRSDLVKMYGACGISLYNSRGIYAIGNKIEFPGTGIRVYDSEAVVVNNFVTVVQNSLGVPVYGLECPSSGGNRLKAYYNSILVVDTNPESSALAIYSAYHVDVRNNILANIGGGYCIESRVSGVTSDHNAFFKTGNSIIKRYLQGYEYFQTIDAWRDASGTELNSFETNPLFVSASDLHASSPQLIGKGLHIPEVALDIDGQPRHPGYPTIGADEFGEFLLSDVVLTEIDESFACGLKNPLSISVRNMGTEQVSTLSARWKLNGLQQADINWTGTLAFGEATNIVLAQLPALVTGSNKIEITIEKTSGSPDMVTSNNSRVLNIVFVQPVSLGPDIMQCADAGQGVVLDAGVFQNYQWSTGSTDRFVSVFQPGQYSVSVKDSRGCVTRDTVMLLRFSPQALITPLGHALSATAADSYAWYLNGVPIANSTDQLYIPQASGSYQVMVISNGCSAISEPYNFVFTGIEDEHFLNRVVCYPNPANGSTLVECPAAIDARSVVLVDNLSRIIPVPYKQSSVNLIELNTSEITEGIYFLKIQRGQQEKVIKLTVIH